MLNKTTWMFLFAAAIVTQTASSQTTAAEPQSAPQSSPASSNTGLSDSAKADSTKSTPGEIAQSTLPHPFIKSVGGVGITPGQSDAAEQMAGICNKRASLSEQANFRRNDHCTCVRLLRQIPV